jgi:site-specific DNA-cytosine methylase
MNVLSLFDGMSCGQQALDRIGFDFTYYASEIDKYAMAVTRKNYPNTIFLGDVRELENLPVIDLLIGGSPCQSFSFAGKRKGMVTKDEIEITSLNQYLKLKSEGFEFEGQSYLFWEYIRILKLLKKKNPNLKFFLENVRMKDNWKTIFDEVVGVKSILVNSSLVSAQSRDRLYWTNLEGFEKPDDKGLILSNIVLDYNQEERPCVTREFNPNSLCHHIANATDISGNETIKRVYALTGKSPTLTTMQGGHREPKIYLGDNKYRKMVPLEFERLQTVYDNYTAYGIDENGKEIIISKTQRNKMIGNGWTVDLIVEFLRLIEDN